MKFKINILKKIKTSTIIELIFSLLYTMCIALIPYVQKELFNGIGNNTKDLLINLAFTYLALILGSAIFQFISQYNEWKRDKEFVKYTKDVIFKSIFGRPNYVFKEKSVGEYLTITNNNVEIIEDEYLSTYVDIIKSIVQLLIYTLSLVVFVDYRIAISIILASLISVIVPKITAKKLAKKRKFYQDSFGNYTDILNDFYLGHMGLDEASKSGIRKYHYQRLSDTEDQKLAFGKFKTFVNIVNGFVMDLVSLTALIMVGYLLISGEITIGAGVATFAYIESFIYPIKYILNDVNAINSCKEIVREAKELGNEYLNNEKEDSCVLPEYNEISSLKLENLEYAINDFYLGPVNIEFKSGNKYLIIGESGSGKSTLLKTIVGQIDCDRGDIYINNESISNNMSEFASEKVFYITQNSHVFSVPFFEQVTHFNAYDEKDIYSYLNKLPETIVKRLINSSNCNELSGGEKQILNILTCALAKKDIVLVDEGLSAIDVNTKKLVRDEIISNYNSKIYIEVSHDLGTDNIDYFDYIIRVKEGEISNVYTKQEYILANNS